jgi:hypothetical protein
MPSLKTPPNPSSKLKQKPQRPTPPPTAPTDLTAPPHVDSGPPRPLPPPDPPDA